MKNKTQKRIVALGGISIKNLRKLKLVGNPDIAGISLFKYKKGP